MQPGVKIAQQIGKNQDNNKKVLNHQDFQKEYDMSKAVYLGGGAFGKVYKVQSTYDKEYWAVKIIECPNFQQFQLAQNEFRNAHQIDKHKNVIYTKQVFEWHKHPSYFVCIVMELGERNLQQEIENRRGLIKPFHDDVLDQIFKESLEGFYFIADKYSIYHRDIKPENLLYDYRTKSVKIADFGLSKSYTDHKIKFTMGGNHTILGTPVYLSPVLWEAYIRKQNFKVDHNLEKSDVFSLGLTFLQTSLLLSIQHIVGCNQQGGEKVIQKQVIRIKNEKMKKLLNNMLYFDEKKRSTYKELLQEFYPETLKFYNQPQIVQAQNPYLIQQKAPEYFCDQHKSPGLYICLEEGCYEILCKDCCLTHNGTHKSNFLQCSQIEQRLIKQNKTLTSLEFLKSNLDKELTKKVEKNQALSEKTLQETLTQIKQNINSYLDKILQDQLNVQRKKTSELKGKISNCSRQLQTQYEQLSKQIKKFKDKKEGRSQLIKDILKQEQNINNLNLKPIQNEFDQISEKAKSNQQLKKFAQNQQQHINDVSNQFKSEIDQILSKISTQVLNNNNNEVKQYQYQIQQQPKKVQQQNIVQLKDQIYHQKNNQQEQQQLQNKGKQQQQDQEEQQQNQADIIKKPINFLKEVKGTSMVLNLYSLDDFMVVASFDRMLQVKQSQKEIKQIQTNSCVRCVLIMKELKCLITGSDDFLLRVYDLEKMGQQSVLAEHSKSISVLQKIKSDQFASGGWDTKITIYQKDSESTSSITFKSIRTIFKHVSLISGIQIFPSFNLMVTVSYDKKIILSSLTQEKCNSYSESHKDWIKQICKLRDNFFATGDEKGIVKIWKIKKTEKQQQQEQKEQKEEGQQEQKQFQYQYQLKKAQEERTLENLDLKVVQDLGNQFSESSQIQNLEYSRLNDILICGCKNGNIYSIQYEKGEILDKFSINDQKNNQTVLGNLDFLTINCHNEIFVASCSTIKMYQIAEWFNQNLNEQNNDEGDKKHRGQNAIEAKQKKRKKNKKCACY